MRKLIIGLLCGTLLATSPVYAAKEPNKEKLRVLGQSICNTYHGNGNNIASEIHKLLTTYMTRHFGYKTTDKKDIIRFINQNTPYMTCSTNKNRTFMMAAFDDAGYGPLFNQLLFDQLVPEDESLLVDVNAVCRCGPNGEPITVLDYIDTILADPRRTDQAPIKEVRELLVSVGAKHFYELPKDVQQLYTDKKPGK